MLLAHLPSTHLAVHIARVHAADLRTDTRTPAVIMPADNAKETTVDVSTDTGSLSATVFVAPEVLELPKLSGLSDQDLALLHTLNASSPNPKKKMYRQLGLNSRKVQTILSARPRRGNIALTAWADLQAAAQFFLQQRPSCRLDEQGVTNLFPVLDKIKKNCKPGGGLLFQRDSLRFTAKV